MNDDSDAARILREREQRRALERARMEEEHLNRQRELDRLESYGLRRTARGTSASPELPTPRRVAGPSSPEMVDETSDRSATLRAPELGLRADREIGGAVHPPSVRAFLQTNPMERFDIHALNVLSLTGVVESARGEPGLLAAVARQADALMGRVKREVDDPLSAGALLRDHVLRWYRESPDDPGWNQLMPERWAGLFSESRVSGGRLVPWINARLWSLREQATREGSIRHRLARGLTRDRKAEALAARTPGQLILAEVAQAILDDLAAHARAPESPTPLVRLSELAVRRQVPTVNEALAILFNAPESGPFVLLHPNRYPDCEEVQIRPPTAGASGAALAYCLVLGRAGRKPGTRARGGSELSSLSTDLESSESDEEPVDEVDAGRIWEADEATSADWRRVVKEVRRERHRLDPPPKDYRGRPAYGALRELILEDASFRAAFLATRWRGRPSGLPLLASLLHKGVLAPEVPTDHEYLEAELGDLVENDPHFNPSDGVWSTHGWTIRREGTHGDGFRFSASRSE